MLARTLRRLLQEGEAAGGGREEQIEGARRAWYEGFVAQAIDAYVADTPLGDLGLAGDRAFLRGEDMATWRATLEPPLAYDFGAWRAYKTGPWGQGPVFLQQLALLDRFDLRAMPPGGPDFIHTVVECAKLAFADREAWYGDPAFVPDRTGELLSRGYNDRRRDLVGETASAELRPGSPDGSMPRLPRWKVSESDHRVRGAGDPTTGARRSPGDTCHLDVVDRWGNLVSATPSGGWLQSSPAIPGLGFCLGTRAQIFTLEPGLPNSLAPGKRPRTTLSPSLAERDDGLRLAFGTPGADRQDQWSLTFFVRLASTAWNLQEAIDAPMWHTDHFPHSFYPHDSRPGTLAVEERVGAAAIAELRRRGHQVEALPPWSAGRLSAVVHDGGAGLLRAAANPRQMQGYAVGR
jgi:gamma-glutamyltranspeptidase/glutathione hydrolase